jgi:hypothetical protein
MDLTDDDCAILAVLTARDNCGRSLSAVAADQEPRGDPREAGATRAAGGTLAATAAAGGAQHGRHKEAALPVLSGPAVSFAWLGGTFHYRAL